MQPGSRENTADLSLQPEVDLSPDSWPISISLQDSRRFEKCRLHISRVTDHLPSTASDQEIIHLAEDLQASILTQDLDFSAMIAQSGKSFPSLLSLRLGNVSHQRITQLLLTLLPTIGNELIQGSIISVDEETIRIRPLPVK